jgi:hypothetical protein
LERAINAKGTENAGAVRLALQRSGKASQTAGLSDCRQTQWVGILRRRYQVPAQTKRRVNRTERRRFTVKRICLRDEETCSEQR